MKFTGLQGVRAYIHTCTQTHVHTHAKYKMTNVRAVLLMKMINKVLRRWMPHTNTHTERRATSFFYHGGDETTDQSRLSAA